MVRFSDPGKTGEEKKYIEGKSEKDVITAQNKATDFGSVIVSS